MKELPKYRLGTFRIPRLMIDSERDKQALLQMFGMCIVVRAECMFARDEIEYTALCDAFDQVECTAEPPEYQVVICELCDDDGNVEGHEIKFERLTF